MGGVSRVDIAKDWAEILPESGNMLIKRYDLINNSQLLIRSFYYAS